MQGGAPSDPSEADDDYSAEGEYEGEAQFNQWLAEQAKSRDPRSKQLTAEQHKGLAKVLDGWEQLSPSQRKARALAYEHGCHTTVYRNGLRMQVTRFGGERVLVFKPEKSDDDDLASEEVLAVVSHDGRRWKDLVNAHGADHKKAKTLQREVKRLHGNSITQAEQLKFLTLCNACMRRKPALKTGPSHPLTPPNTPQHPLSPS